jgi:hypothetical protein
MLFAQIDTKSWIDILERFGWPTLIVVVFSWGGWQGFKKYIWPLVLEQRAQNAKQLEESRLARERERSDFLAALSDVTVKHNQAVAKLAESVDGIRDEVRRSKG